MAAEGVIHVQRTFWRLPARSAAPGTRKAAVRLCRVKRVKVKPETKGQRRVRIHQAVRPRVAEWIRRARREQARLTHVLNVYASPVKAGGRSLAGDSYVEAAMAGDPRILLDVIVEIICQFQGIGREIEVVVQPAATTAFPGTPEKVEEMRKRQERFQALHTDRDAKRS
jgi:hypothetical protein